MCRRFSVRQVLAAELSDIRAINFGGTGECGGPIAARSPLRWLTQMIAFAGTGG
jgi:hypothetical protein